MFAVGMWHRAVDTWIHGNQVARAPFSQLAGVSVSPPWPAPFMYLRPRPRPRPRPCPRRRRRLAQPKRRLIPEPLVPTRASADRFTAAWLFLCARWWPSSLILPAFTHAMPCPALPCHGSTHASTPCPSPMPPPTLPERCPPVRAPASLPRPGVALVTVARVPLARLHNEPPNTTWAGGRRVAS
jgi:hypothetical protein